LKNTSDLPRADGWFHDFVYVLDLHDALRDVELTGIGAELQVRDLQKIRLGPTLVEKDTKLKLKMVDDISSF
jgi:hypothetical protein